MGGHRRRAALAHPHRTLIATFIAWKSLLLAISIGACIGAAYDTSGSLVVLGVDADSARDSNRHASEPSSLVGTLLTRFASWDAVYFVSAAHRGYLFEQEWAFGSGLPMTIRSIIKAVIHFGLLSDAPPDGQALESLVGILVVNTAHLFSVIILYRLGLLLWRHKPQGSVIALVAALLHVVSPAGLFLSAPYAESSCALLSFLGYLLYAHGCLASPSIKGDGYRIMAGLAFGLATAFRSNGILNGIPFAWEVIQLFLPRLVNALTSIGRERDREVLSTVSAVRRFLALIVGGVAVAAGSLVPQAVAYQRFCASPPSSAEETPVPRPPWCDALVPSIYTYVQGHYWDNGFLRYWTLSNVPLFLLAAPMLAVMAKSGVHYLVSARTETAPRRLKETDGKPPNGGPEPGRLVELVRGAAAAQFLLAVMVLANSHVQIITRISSGYPLWHFWLADKFVSGDPWGKRAVMFMIMYASIQGVLFTSFLPPA
ncbi:hypothetical protein OQA88_9053 [Cercophora sp. LCS_1]